MRAPHGEEDGQPLQEPDREIYRGCLLGGAIGDALGAAVEFMSWSEIQRQFGTTGLQDYSPAYGKIGAITDDTQMTLFTGEGLLRAELRSRIKGTQPPYVASMSRSYMRWLHTQGETHSQLTEIDGWLMEQSALFHQRAPGVTCLTALAGATTCGEMVTNDSKGCGGVMRVAPIGLFLARKWGPALDTHSADIFQLGADAARLTHGHPSGYLSAGFFALLIAWLSAGTHLEEAITRCLAVLVRHEGHLETKEIVQQATELAATHVPREQAFGRLGEGWVGEEALAIAIFCALTADNFREAVLDAVNHGGDSDSTGAMTGNILGARLGESAIPSDWLERLELREVISTLADDLHDHETQTCGDNIPETSESGFQHRYPPS